MTNAQRDNILAASIGAAPALPPMTGKTCACCGQHTKGRQWHNRDTGYGICPACIKWQRGRHVSEAEIRDLYGIEGINFLKS